MKQKNKNLDLQRCLFQIIKIISKGGGTVKVISVPLRLFQNAVSPTETDLLLCFGFLLTESVDSVTKNVFEGNSVLEYLQKKFGFFTKENEKKKKTWLMKPHYFWNNLNGTEITLTVPPPPPLPCYKKISYTFLNLEKRPRHFQGCFTTQKMREDLLSPTHYKSYHLNNYRSLYALIRRHALWENSQNTSVYEFFLLKESLRMSV